MAVFGRRGMTLAADIRHLDFVDALRGYAILGVIAVHASAAVPDLEWPLRLLADQGARGVQLFFLVSAFTLTLSWHERRDGVGPFLVRRLFRVGPMFWLAMAFFTAMEASGPPSWPSILATATFTHALHPQTIEAIVPGGWSIGDEMIFYLLLPLLVATLRSWTATTLALAAAVCLSLLMAALAHYGWLFPGLDREAVEQFVFLSFPNQLAAFLGGMLVFHLLQAFSAAPSRATLRVGLVLSVGAMVAVPFIAMALHPYLSHTAYLMPTVYTLPFGLCTWCLAKGGGGLVVNRLIEYVGEVSYSAYFWHFPVLGLLSQSPPPFGAPAAGWLRFLATYAAAVALTIAVSSITYRLIERPMINVGRRLALRLAAKRVAVAG
jgi:exopolysaccharide production protein ExoZ